MSDHELPELDALAHDAPPRPPPLPAELEAELATLAPAPPRRPHRQLAIVAAASLVYAGALLGVLTLRADLGELPVAWIAGAGLAWAVGFVVPAYLALVPRAGTMTSRWQLAAVAVGITAVAYVVLGYHVHPSGPSSLDYGAEHFMRGHWCMWLGLATAFVPVVLGAIFLRGALPVGSRWIAAGLGAAGGCLGGLLLHMHCRIADGYHIGFIHGGVVAVAALLSAILVPRATDRPFR
jgi:negative regulator of sigma F NrsF-like protein